MVDGGYKLIYRRSNCLLSFEKMEDVIYEYKIPIVFVDDLDGIVY